MVTELHVVLQHLLTVFSQNFFYVLPIPEGGVPTLVQCNHIFRVRQLMLLFDE